MRLLSEPEARTTRPKRRPVRRPRLSAKRLRQVLIAAGALAGAGTLASGGWYVAESGLIEKSRMTINQAGDLAARHLGLVLSDILVEGRYRTGRDALVETLAISRGTPILAIDLAALHERLTALPWVRTATVERRLPDTLFVKIEERVPMALWQRGNSLDLIDTDGRVIDGQNVRRFADLPIVIGEEAPARAREFLAVLAREPDLAGRVRAISWIGNRRWDVHLDSGIDVELPERNPDQAWGHLAQLQRDHRVLDRDVIAIDLRLPNQLVVRVAPDLTDRLRKPGKDT